MIGHYSQYFERKQDPDTGEWEFAFDWAKLKPIHKSFLDSLIVELCLPNSRIPKQVLYQLLHEAMEESPKDAKQFSQAVWDAVGDLSVGSRSRGRLRSMIIVLLTTMRNARVNRPDHRRAAVHA